MLVPDRMVRHGETGNEKSSGRPSFPGTLPGKRSGLWSGRKYRNTEFTLEKEFYDEEPLDILEEELL